jgi:hypothetical protein
MNQQPTESAPPEVDQQAVREGTVSAGEVGTADGGAKANSGSEVVIGEIPAADEPTTMLWTARCSEPSHDLLGHFGTREDAENARAEHLAAAHGGTST